MPLGGLIGIAASIASSYKSSYRVHFDASKIITTIQENNQKQREKNNQALQSSGDNAQIPDPNDENNNFQGGLSNEEARKLARLLGYKQTKEGNFYSHGKLKFIKGNRIITPDRDRHNGGFWKLFNRQGKRLGTLNKNGEIIKR